jgi:hypothetical protein
MPNVKQAINIFLATINFFAVIKAIQVFFALSHFSVKDTLLCMFKTIQVVKIVGGVFFIFIFFFL